MFQAHLPPSHPRASSYCTALVQCKVSDVKSERMTLLLTAIVLGEQLGNVKIL